VLRPEEAMVLEMLRSEESLQIDEILDALKTQLNLLRSVYGALRKGTRGWALVSAWELGLSHVLKGHDFSRAESDT
jgi:hypothetical protein